MSDEQEAKTGPTEAITDLRAEIELRAYFKYCERGCAPGCDVDDWLAAEQEILTERAAVPPARATESPEASPDTAGSEAVSADSPGGRRERASKGSARR